MGGWIHLGTYLNDCDSQIYCLYWLLQLAGRILISNQMPFGPISFSDLSSMFNYHVMYVMHPFVSRFITALTLTRFGDQKHANCHLADMIIHSIFLAALQWFVSLCIG